MKRILILTILAAIAALAVASTGSAWVPPPPPPTTIGGAVSGLGSASEGCTYETMTMLPVQTQFGFRVVISTNWNHANVDLYIWGPKGFPLVAPAKLKKPVSKVGALNVFSYDMHTQAKGRFSMIAYLRTSTGACLMTNTITLQ